MSSLRYSNLQALVVDDFDSFRTTLVKMLQSFGVKYIETAETGTDCIQRCEAKQFDLILCDYNLGKDKNGQQVLEEMRHRKMLSPNALFILISAESSRSVIMSAYDNEPDAYLAKPITGKVLKQRCDRLLRQQMELSAINIAFAEERLEDAAKLLKEKISSGSRVSSRCQKRLGDLYLQMGRHKEAEMVFRQALEVRTLDWAKVGMARARYAAGKKAEAKEWLEDILRKNPLCMQAYDVLTTILREEGETEKLVQTLKMAVEYSPMAILRQEQLANAAIDCNDNRLAAQAYRHTVRLGKHSCHNKRDNHINFGRATANLAKESERSVSDLCREAINVLEDLDHTFSQNDEEKVQMWLVESQIHIGQGNKKGAADAFTKGEFHYLQLENIEELDTELDFVQSLMASGEVNRAEDCLKELTHRFKDNQHALEKIDRLLEEPLSEKNRAKVSVMNKEGIAHYDREEYQAAINSFKQARRLFPNHIGVQLNYVQAIEGELQVKGFDSQLFHGAQKVLASVKTRIDNGHSQYERYLQLQDMLLSHKKS